MRLLNCDGDNIRLVEFKDKPPEYAILSHTWSQNDGDEVTFQDMEAENAKNRPGYKKIEFCAIQASRDNLKYFWVDTCCINKNSSSELEESLNSMFKWYKDSKKCYVYLSDVSKDEPEYNKEPTSWESAFRNSRWFTRGWTLQELIAPNSVTFFSSEGLVLGDKHSLESVIREITGIPVEVLQNSDAISQISVAERFSWMKRRQTKRSEDKAYALLGIFDVVTPFMYGWKETKAMQYLEELVEKDQKSKISFADADNYLQNDYYDDMRLRIERLSGKRLDIGTCYINLAVVEPDPGQRVRDSSSASSANANSSPFDILRRLKVKTPESDMKVNLHELFESSRDSHKQLNKVRRILIRGRAGVGKTTLCTKIVFDFKCQKLWNHLFDRILWVPLRSLKTWQSNLCNFKEFAHHLYFRHHEFGDILAERLDKAVGFGKHYGGDERTMFILDGLDEVSQTWNSGEPKHEFLVKLLNQPNVIITSRPHAQIPQHVMRGIDIELETIGFYPDQVTEYLKMSFQDNGKVTKAEAILRKFPLIQGLVRIPILLDAFCYTWDTLNISGSHAIPETMTSFYQAIVHELLKKDVVRLEMKCEGRLVTEAVAANLQPSQVEEAAKDQVLLLENLAFVGIFQDEIEFKPGSRDTVLRALSPDNAVLPDHSLRHISFLRTSDSIRVGENVSYHFLHLTFQEFFAARYFVRQWVSSNLLKCLHLSDGRVESVPMDNFVVKHKYEQRYDIFWRFVTGLLEDKGSTEVESFFHMIQDPQTRDLLGPMHHRLIMHCLGEVSPQMSLRPALEAQLLRWTVFEINYDGMARLVKEMEFPVRILYEILQSSETELFKAVLKALDRRDYIPDSILPFILSRLEDPDDIMRQYAIEALVNQGSNPEVQKAVLGRLDDSNQLIKRVAVTALDSQSLPPTVQHTLLGLYQNSGYGLQEAVSKALFKCHVLDPHVRQAILALLDSRIHSSRWGTSQGLAQSRISDPSMQRSLLARLGHPDLDVRDAVCSSLGRSQISDPQAQQALLAQLDDPDIRVRQGASFILGSQTLFELIQQLLLAQLDNPDYTPKWAVSKVLASQVSRPRVRQILLAQLNDDASSIREAAVRALGSSKASDPEVQRAILDKLDDPDHSVRRTASGFLLHQVSNAQVKQKFLTRLGDDDYTVRKMAVQALMKDGVFDPQVHDALLAQLNAPDYYVRSVALKALTSQHLTISLQEVFFSHLGSPYHDIREAAARTLGKHQFLDSHIQKGLLSRLENPGSCSRSTLIIAVESLACDKKVRGTLLTLLDDPEKGVRRAAAEVLTSQTSDSQILDALLARLEDPDVIFRAIVSKVLIIQASSLQVRPAILAGLGSSFINTRQAAVQALVSQASDPQMRQLMLDQLNSSYWMIRWVAEALATQASNIDVQQAFLSQISTSDDWFIIQLAIKVLRSQASNSHVRAAILKELGGPSRELVESKVSNLLDIYGDKLELIFEHDAQKFYDLLLNRSLVGSLSLHVESGKLTLKTPWGNAKTSRTKVEQITKYIKRAQKENGVPGYDTQVDDHASKSSMHDGSSTKSSMKHKRRSLMTPLVSKFLNHRH